MFQGQSTILVTGGAGYIGSHAVLALKQAGYEVIVLDNLSYGHRELVEQVLQVKLIVGDISDRALLDHIFITHNITAVMHFAAYIAVGESVTDPAKYYRNNVTGTLTLLEAMIAASIKTFVFSSSCALYGIPKSIPLVEDHPQDPISPYATTKWMVERILSDFDQAYNLKSVCFRYFNAAGADPTGLLGEDHTPETHLIPLVIFAALGKRESVSIFGTDYPTRDGTCIRDYIHVTDLAQAHVLGLEYLLNGGESTVFNLGNGSGFSVREVIETTREVTGKDIKIVECDRRPGDPPVLVGSSDKARNVLGWQPQYSDLKDILTHAWQWHQQRHGTYFRREIPELLSEGRREIRARNYFSS
ncbi:MAG TPA: UDP-glucose 4-epimerase GalE [Cyanobacteria bacterium UBA12227]|nr:UDP-glucose 4-epimerase GalE [Cyanobacteria bacterium UBA12227]HAX88061.1 UDP-glucose 4-epimerase GalE [Cyanobacteria bacterium UBA11370]